jgi:cupin superfamily acireductone dioxygenase involved in methionine salvage
MNAQQKLPNGVTLYKWPHQSMPTAESVAQEMEDFGFKSYDLQTVPPWFVRSRHAHDEEEIRGAVDGVITFHFDEGPVTIEAGDILIIPGGVAHLVKTHNGNTFSAYKGSRSGERHVTEHGDGKGSIEDLGAQGGS